MPIGPFIVNKLKDALFFIKTNKCPGHNKINFNAISV